MSFPKPTRKPSKKRRDAAKHRAVYAAVTARDICCRCCGRTWGLHRHHLVFRSQGGETSPQNVVTLCSKCHMDVHSRRLVVGGSDANGVLVFSWGVRHGEDTDTKGRRSDTTGTATALSDGEWIHQSQVADS